MKWIAAWVLMALTMDCLGSDTQSFTNGLREYHEGNYAQSAKNFSSATPSASSLFNLGDAEWQLGHSGPAILAWERAQWLDPFDASPKGNLRFARKARMLDNPELAWYEICSTWLPVNTWPWIACVSLWLAISLVVLPGVFRERRAGWHQALAAAGFAIFLLTLPAMYGVQTRANMGVVLPHDAPLRLTPTEEGQTIARLAAGETARLERRRGRYLFIHTATAAGWIDRDQFGFIAGNP